MKNTEECRLCPKPGQTYEHYCFLHHEWDVRKAREITAGRAADRMVTPEELIQYGLPVRRKEPTVDADGVTHFTISMFAVDEKHLAHIPEEKLTEPVIFAPLPTGGITEGNYILIDGSHRAVRLAREGRDVPAIVLTVQESFDCFCIDRFTPAERRRMKLFPGMKRKKTQSGRGR